METASLNRANDQGGHAEIRSAWDCPNFERAECNCLTCPVEPDKCLLGSSSNDEDERRS